MNSIEGTKIIENQPQSNSLINKMMLVTRKLKEYRDYGIEADEQELMDIVGDARITVGVLNGETIKTYTITNEGVKVNEEPCRQRTLDNY